jgi:hypothetical protein
MRFIKIKEFVKTLLISCALLLSGAVITASAQDDMKVKTGYDIDNMKHQDMDYVQQINDIIETYPAFTYNYSIEDGKVTDVTITGIDNEVDRKRLEVVLFNLNSKRNMVNAQADRVGVFYNIDNNARYTEGEKALERELLTHLEYPEGAKDWGVQGTIYVKVIVDDEGKIPFATTSTNIESSVERYVDDLREQAVAAVKATSGDWEPAEVEGVEVASLAVIPVTFELSDHPHLY